MKTFMEWAKEKADIRGSRSVDIQREFIRKLEQVLNVDYWAYNNISYFINMDAKQNKEKSGCCGECDNCATKKRIEENRKGQENLQNEIYNSMSDGKFTTDIIIKEKIDKKKHKLNCLEKEYSNLKDKCWNYNCKTLKSLGVLKKEELDLFDLIYELMMEKEKSPENEYYSYIRKNEWEKISQKKREQLVECFKDLFDLERWHCPEEYFPVLEKKITEPQKFRIFYQLSKIYGYFEYEWDIFESYINEYEDDLYCISSKMEKVDREYQKIEKEKLKKESVADKKIREESDRKMVEKVNNIISGRCQVENNE